MSSHCRNRYLVLLFASVAFASQANAHEAHVHGVATMDIAIDDTHIMVNLSSPLANLVGFEHLPGNDQERQSILNMATLLRKPGVIVATPAAAQCKIDNIALASPELPARLLGEPHAIGKDAKDSHTHQHTHDAGHADLDATVVLSCINMQQLQYIDVPLPTIVKDIHRINVQVVTPTRQRAATLDATQSRIRLD